MSSIKTVKPEQLKKWLDAKKAVLIDVREADEHAEECISCAKSIPLNEFNPKDFADEKKYVVIHCRLGRRSLDACDKLIKQNPKLKVYSLDGGIESWKKAGLTVQKGAGDMSCMSVSRQKNIIVGGLIAVGILLGLIYPIFYLVPFILGCSLIYNGLSGWCGFEEFMKKLPWNN